MKDADKTRMRFLPDHFYDHPKVVCSPGSCLARLQPSFSKEIARDEGT